MFSQWSVGVTSEAETSRLVAWSPDGNSWVEAEELRDSRMFFFHGGLPSTCWRAYEESTSASLHGLGEMERENLKEGKTPSSFTIVGTTQLFFLIF